MTSPCETRPTTARTVAGAPGGWCCSCRQWRRRRGHAPTRRRRARRHPAQPGAIARPDRPRLRASLSSARRRSVADGAHARRRDDLPGTPRRPRRRRSRPRSARTTRLERGRGRGGAVSYAKSRARRRALRRRGLPRRPVGDAAHPAALVDERGRLRVPPRDRAAGRRPAARHRPPGEAGPGRGRRSRPTRRGPSATGSTSSSTRSSGQLPAREEAALTTATAARDQAQFWLARWQAIVGGPATTIMGPTLLGADELATWFTATRHTAEHDRPDRGADPVLRRGGDGGRASGPTSPSPSRCSRPAASRSRPAARCAGPTTTSRAWARATAATAATRFPDARTGVRAQLQQLRVYADPNAHQRGAEPAGGEPEARPSPPQGQGADLGRPHRHLGDGRHLRRPRSSAIYAEMLAWLTDRAESEPSGRAAGYRSPGMTVEHQHDRLPALRRRQPLLRGDRRVHPPPRPGAREAHDAVGRDQRASSGCSSAGGSTASSRTRRSTRSPGPARSTTTSGARRPATTSAPRSATSSRSARRTASRRPALALMDEQGIEGCFLFPTLGVGMEQPLVARPRGRARRVPRVQPVAARRLDVRLRGPDLRRAVLHAARSRRRGARGRLGARARRAR